MPKVERRAEVAKTEVAEVYLEIRTLLKDQERRVAQLVARDAVTGSGGRDGLNRGDGGLGQKNGIPDTTGQAAVSNADPDPDHPAPIDQVHRKAVASLRAARDARDQLLLIDGHLEALDVSQADAKPPEPCECCAAADRQSPMEISTMAAHRLERFYDLCWWCYKRTCRTGKLPTVDQVRRHHAG